MTVGARAAAAVHAERQTKTLRRSLERAERRAQAAEGPACQKSRAAKRWRARAMRAPPAARTMVSAPSYATTKASATAPAPTVTSASYALPVAMRADAGNRCTRRGEKGRHNSTPDGVHASASTCAV